jgi:hypothetical protein
VTQVLRETQEPRDSLVRQLIQVQQERKETQERKELRETQAL